MIRSTIVERQRVHVDGAAQLYDDLLAAAAAGDSLRDLARRLAGGCGALDFADAKAASAASGHSVVVAARTSDDPVLAVRWFAPGESTTVHEHGTWGVLAVLEGEDVYDRFTVDSTGAPGADTTFWLRTGDSLWWEEPPNDIHRQVGGPAGALEVLLLGRHPDGADLRSFERPPAPFGESGRVIDAFRRAYESGSAEPLGAVYDPGVVADVCVPAWRFQVSGSNTVLALLADEEFGVGGYRLRSFRGLPADDAAVIEVDVQFDAEGERRRWRSVHVARLRAGLVVEQVTYCTGHWHASDIERQAVEAAMVRP